MWHLQWLQQLQQWCGMTPCIFLRCGWTISKKLNFITYLRVCQWHFFLRKHRSSTTGNMHMCRIVVFVVYFWRIVRTSFGFGSVQHIYGRDRALAMPHESPWPATRMLGAEMGRTNRFALILASKYCSTQWRRTSRGVCCGWTPPTPPEMLNLEACTLGACLAPWELASQNK